MNVYDFDGTIYNGDSGVDFVKFMFRKKKMLVLKYLVFSLKYIIRYKLKKIPFKEMKQNLFAFVKEVDDLKSFTEEFAEIHKNNIKDYYLRLRRDDDLVISASLDFYLIPLCNKMNINNVLCTKYDVENGMIIGENCKGDEKVRRFNEAYGNNAVIENAYGDSKNDVPIIKRALEGYIIKGNEIVPFTDDFKF